MEPIIHAKIEAPPKPYGGVAVTQSGGTVKFTAPKDLLNANFPLGPEASNGTVTFEVPSAPATASSNPVAINIAKQFKENQQNAVVYSYGQRGSSKRDTMLQLCGQILKDVFASPNASSTYVISCYSIGSTDNVVDFVDPENEEGIIAESHRVGPFVSKVEKKKVRTGAEVSQLLQEIGKNIQKYFAATTKLPASPEEEALPPYNSDTVVLVLQRLDAAADEIEHNSLTFIALGDSERPVLCGIDVLQMNQYDRLQKNLCAVCGILSAIKCNRLRIPFGKAKLTSMLKRAYNAEKNNPFNETNKPTISYMIIHVLNDEGSAEESFHALVVARRLQSNMGAGIGSVGPATRDLAAEKWRIEQDIVELKDELAIAKAVYDYKPCIYDQAKPVQNVYDEEQKRVGAIQKRKEEAKQKAHEEMRELAQKEAQKYIEQMEKEAGKTLAELEQALRERRAETAQLQAERSAKMKEHEKHLEKIRRKRDEEETHVEKLREELQELENELKGKEELINKKTKQLELATRDQAKGRQAILAERETIRQQRAQLYHQRKEERAKWVQEIQETNAKLMKQVRALETLRKEAAASAGQNADDVDDGETEAGVQADIDGINNYLPKLISLDDVPADAEATEAIRKQLEDYFQQEKEEYAAKLQAEKDRLTNLQQHVETYKSKVAEFHAKQKKEMINEALKKENHLQSLVDQVIQYLQYGLKMTKVSSTGNVRRRYFFLAEDCRKIHACELDATGQASASSRRKPTMTIMLKDVKRVVLGIYTPSFLNFCGGEAPELRKGREGAMRDDGSFSNAFTVLPLTPQTLGRYNYRSFCLELTNGKTVELVCDQDSDCEAWIVALKRFFCFKSEYEKRVDARQHRPVRECTAQIVWGAPLDVRGRPGLEKLSVDEASFCSEHHVPPALYSRMKEEMVQKSQTTLVTVFDVRISSTLDFFRAQYLHEFLVEHGLIPSTL